MKLEALRREALNLPEKERADLAYDLLHSLDDEGSPDPDHERLWKEEIARRMQAVADGTAEFYPAEDVIASIRARYS